MVQSLEAARCVEEGVITDVREADVGSILGFGFAPFTGGTLSYIDMMGTKRFVDLCKKLEKKYGAALRSRRSCSSTWRRRATPSTAASRRARRRRREQRASPQIVPAGIDFGRRGTTSHAVAAVIALPDGARVWSRPFSRGCPPSALIMARDQIDMTPIESRDELVAWFAEGVKPKAEFRIGTEHEKFPFTVEGHRPIPYEGRRSIRALLEGMQHLLGWEPILEDGNIIGLFDVTGGGAISLEPGGQFELSGAPVETVHQTCSELMAHLAQVREVARPLGIGFLGLGMTPTWTRADIPTMPKGRYRIMTAYMPKVGKLGLDMMYRTCTVQTNLDFSSEADMVKKLRVSLALQPVATALFANSPFTEGKPNGFLSFRSEIWRDTDNDARRHAAVGVRARHGLRALGRLRARRADVFRQARRRIHRRRRANRSAI